MLQTGFSTKKVKLIRSELKIKKLMFLWKINVIVARILDKFYVNQMLG
jgi:hypothetical protein